MGAQTSRSSHEDVPPDFYDAALRTNLIQRLWHKRRLQRISALISKTNGRILDIGCDGITLTEAVAARAAAKEVVGIDIAEEAAAYSKGRRPDFHMAVGHGEQLPFREAALDVIVCLEVLEHVEHPHKLLSENEAMLEDGWLRLGHSAYGDPAIQASVVLVDSIRQRESLAPRPRPEVSR